MAIAFDASSKQKTDDTSATWSHTCTGDDRILIVSVAVGGGATITSIKYDGVDMTQINLIAGGGTSFDNVYLYQLVAPSTGANNVVVNISASNFLYSIASSFTGVTQSNPIDVEDTNQSTRTVVSGSLTTTVDNTWLVGAAYKVTHVSNITWTPGANTTEREEEATNGWFTIVDTNSAQTPAGSKTITTTASASHNIVFSFCAISPILPDVTISPSAFTLSTSEQAPSLFIDISQSAVFGLTAGLPVPSMDAPMPFNRGTVGTQDIATRFPITEGLIAGTTRQTGNPNLEAQEKGSF